VAAAGRQADNGVERGQLTTKFGSVPKWAEERLEKATSGQIERWSKKILTAETLGASWAKSSSFE